MPTMAYFTDFLASTAEISNLLSVLAVLGGLLVMFVFLLRLIYQVCWICSYFDWLGPGTNTTRMAKPLLNGIH